MIVAFSGIELLLATLVFFVTSIFALEVLVGSILHRSQSEAPAARFAGKLAVLVPAHNEEKGIAKTLRDILSNLSAQDRLIVVADNCTDRTADVASELGAEVTARFDQSKLGKGYALDWGMSYLGADPPDVVIVVDADCQILSGSLRGLAAEAIRRNRPVQALYIMTSSSRSTVGQQVAEFAWRVRNQVRPLGLRYMGLPSQLMGTGMAFPWHVISNVNLASGQIVEDLKLGLDLARLGSAPDFCPSVVVSSSFPSSVEGLRAQRQRWEHGHIYLIGRVAIPLLWTGLKRRDLRLVALSLDLMVPPISLLIFVIFALLLVCGLSLPLGLASSSLSMSLCCIGLLTLSISAAWLRFGKDILPARSLFRIPIYLAEKLPVYAKLLVGKRVSSWVRSDRT